MAELDNVGHTCPKCTRSWVYYDCARDSCTRTISQCPRCRNDSYWVLVDDINQLQAARPLSVWAYLETFASWVKEVRNEKAKT